MGKNELAEEARRVLLQIVMARMGHVNESTAKKAAEEYMELDAGESPKESRFNLSEAVAKMAAEIYADVLVPNAVSKEFTDKFFAIVKSYGLLEGMREAGVENIIIADAESLDKYISKEGEHVVRRDEGWEPDPRTKAASEVVEMAVAEAQEYARREDE